MGGANAPPIPTPFPDIATLIRATNCRYPPPAAETGASSRKAIFAQLLSAVVSTEIPITKARCEFERPRKGRSVARFLVRSDPHIEVGTSWLARPLRVRLQLNIRWGPIAKDPLSRSAGLAKAATITWCSRTPGRAAASIALHARAISHQREVAALRAHLAFVALGL